MTGFQKDWFIVYIRQKVGVVTYFFLNGKVLFSQVGVTTKFSNSMFFKMKKNYNKKNILMIFRYVSFDDFDSMLLSSLIKPVEQKNSVLPWGHNCFAKGPPWSRPRLLRLLLKSPASPPKNKCEVWGWNFLFSILELSRQIHEYFGQPCPCCHCRPNCQIPQGRGIDLEKLSKV